MTDPNWKGYRVYSPDHPETRSKPVTLEEAKRLLPLYDDKYGEDGLDFVIQEQQWITLDFPLTSAPEWGTVEP